MKRLPMRKIKEALRLKAAGLPQREIAASLNVGRSTVGEYLNRAKQAGLSWPLQDDACDQALEQRLFSSPGRGRQQQERLQPDWAHLHRELCRKSVTLRLLWEEYRAVHPDGYGYSQFCAQLEDALDLGWQTMTECFRPEQLLMKQNLIDKYFPTQADQEAV